MNKQDKLKISFIIIFAYVGVAALSLLFGFLVGKDSTSGNIAYWIFKGICIAWLVVDMIAFAISRHVGKHLPIAFIGILIQVIPALLRIGYASNGKAYTWLIIVCAIIMLILITSTMLFGVGSDITKRAEDRAKPSSNAKHDN